MVKTWIDGAPWASALATDDRTTKKLGWRRRARSLGSLVLLAGLVVGVGVAQAQAPDPGQLAERNYDAREVLTRDLAIEPSAEQSRAIDRMRAHLPDLGATIDPTSGTTRTLYNQTGFLTGPSLDASSPLEIGLGFVAANRQLFGLAEGDLAQYRMQDEVASQVTGATHVYLLQEHQGLPVYNGQLQLNISRDGRVVGVNNAFVHDLRGHAPGRTPALEAVDAVRAAADHLGLRPGRDIRTSSVGDDAQLSTTIDGKGISFSAIEARLMWLPIRAGDVRLVWNFQIETLDTQHWYDMNVDATDGRVWTRFDWISEEQFRVYEQPVESPIHTSPLPPADARTLQIDPQDSTASPNGWFDAGTTLMDGNNVHACADANANNACDAGQPSCGAGLDCDFPINLSAQPSSSQPAAIANLFYWNNIIHDVQYQYGFDEAAGNFQESNFGRGGAGSDSVNAEAQDGSGNCNARFSTPPDGGNGRMQMFTCTNANPARDGDYDNGVIAHEYGHGISNRQVGGPGNSSCLGNRQQAGEGWSDYWALWYSAEVGDQGTDARGVGAYLFNEAAVGGTIRDLPYSTSPAVNNWTYESINGAALPHGVGSRWAQVAWEVYWALVDKYGFDPDPYNVAAAAGNHRANLYVNEGLKNTACRPTFVNNRDGMIQAATNLFGGEDVCLLWESFASFGLGTNAVSGGSNSTNPTNGFDVPASCDDPPPPASCPAGSLDFSNLSLVSYSNQNASNIMSVLDNGTTLQLQGNTWKRTSQSFTITPDTLVEFEFASSNEGEIHAIGFDENDTLNDDARHFQFFGTQNWTGTGRVASFTETYTGNGDFQSFSIPVGQFYTGSMNLAFTNDKDSGTLNNEGRFRCVRVFEDDGGGGGDCSVEIDFESGAAGWTNSGASSCTTGAFVVGTPTQQTSTIVTQVAGDNTTGTGNALFTATNSSVGNADVDDGVCIAESPVFTVGEASDLSVAYFHGQRDAGDDASGDFFRLEVSTDGGSSFTPLVSFGDVRNVASWTDATTTIPAGSQVQIRVQASDGAGPGDIVEGGVDDLSICPTP